MSAEYVGWKPLVHEGHRTGYAWHPYLVTHDFDPSRCAGAGIQLQIGFATEAECQAFINAHLASRAVLGRPPEETT